MVIVAVLLLPTAASAKEVTKIIVVGANGRSVNLGSGWSLYNQIRPANSTQTDSSRIVATALAAGRALGFTAKTGASSTDSNVPMSLGIPAITIDGGGIGTGAHSLGEAYDDGPNGWLGPQWALLVVAALAGVR